MPRLMTCLLLAALAVAAPREASAWIAGDAGNKPVADPGWPKGAEAIFNHSGRVAWWMGPPFGGGQWHAECRGDAKAFNAVLADFAKLDVIDVKKKRLVVHDGTGHSFWLAPNNEPEKRAAARIDWSLMVWQPASWEQLRKLPADLNPTEAGDTAPPAQIDVYTGALRWADLIVPKGIEVDDRRLEAHGFTADDGVVLEGKVTDLATGRPIAATIQLQRVEPKQPRGYSYPVIAETRADAQGHWVLKHAPEGRVRLVVGADGFVSRVAGYDHVDDQPRWQSYDCGLSISAPVSGRITDEAGAPLADVAVRLGDIRPESGGRYESPFEYTFKTDADGRFRADRVPTGTATIWLHKPGYCRPGLGLPIATPKADVELQMLKSASVRVTVDFNGKERPGDYTVKIEPEGGEAVGTYGGSGSLSAENEIAFENVPPGRYVLRGQPNPSSGDQQTEPVAVDLKGGLSAEVTLKAK